VTLIEEFEGKQFLPPAFEARVLANSATQRKFLSLSHPVALARFVAFAKSRMQTAGSDVYLRGQTGDCPGMVPSLFRGVPHDSLLARFSAYQNALEAIQHEVGYNRFTRENAGAVFQHYGLNTPWIDLVDNFYTALWFATHEHVNYNGQSYYRRSRCEHGWIYLIAPGQHNQSPLVYVDLRKEQSSMNVRLQVQHGVSVASQGDLYDPVLFDYDAFVVACIRVPNDRRFQLDGSLARSQFYFPPPDLDQSFRLLLTSRANELLSDAESRLRLPSEALGRIRAVRYRAPRATLQNRAQTI
jgi:hypothetical protein